MNNTMTTTAITEAIEAGKGTDMVDWYALSDHLSESGDGSLLGHEREGMAFLILASRAVLHGHRHRHQAAQLLALAGECGVLRTARSVAALCYAIDQRAGRAAQDWSALARRWPYVGHRNVNSGMRTTYTIWRGAVAKADGVEPGNFDCVLGLTQILCYTVGEMLDAEVYPVRSVDAEGATVTVGGEQKKVTWGELRAAKAQDDDRLVAVYCAIDEQARRLARAAGVEVPNA